LHLGELIVKSELCWLDENFLMILDGFSDCSKNMLHNLGLLPSHLLQLFLQLYRLLVLLGKL
jgi:hypothetical protein